MASATMQEIDENSYDVKLQDVFADIIIMDMWSLSVKWNDCCNHDLDKEHVNNLKDIFDAGVNQTAEDNWMKATLFSSEWHALIEFLIEQAKDGQPMSFKNVDSLCKHVRTPHVVSYIDTSTTIIASEEIPVISILKAEQHQWSALILLNDERHSHVESSEEKVKRVQRVSTEIRQNVKQTKLVFMLTYHRIINEL